MEADDKLHCLRLNLARRGFDIMPICPICEEVESREHMTLHCGWMRQVWRGTLGWGDGDLQHASVEMGLTQMAAIKRSPWLTHLNVWRLCMITCLCIWKEGCKCAFENKQPNLTWVIQDITRDYGEIMANMQRQQLGQNQSLRLWTKPNEGVIKINCNAA